MLIIVRMEGEPAPLLAAAERALEAVGMPDGLLARALAPTPTGVLLMNLWSDEEARRRSNDDPAHRRALVESGIEGVTTRRVVERYETAATDLAP